MVTLVQYPPRAGSSTAATTDGKEPKPRKPNEYIKINLNSLRHEDYTFDSRKN